MGGHIQDRVVMVTGGGGGFGRLICEKAAALGASIVCTDVDEAGLTGTAASVLAAGGRILHQRADVTVLSDLQAAVTAGVREFGRIVVTLMRTRDSTCSEQVGAETCSLPLGHLLAALPGVCQTSGRALSRAPDPEIPPCVETASAVTSPSSVTPPPS